MSIPYPSPAMWSQTVYDRYAPPTRYPLTLEHVAKFLATKEEYEPIGSTGHPRDCLLAQTLNWLYPQQAPWGVSPTSYGPFAYEASLMQYAPYTPQQLLLLSTQLIDLVYCFDHMRNPGEARLVRKAELREHLQFLEKTRSHKLPCAVTALFPERSREQERNLPPWMEDRSYEAWVAQKTHRYDNYPFMHSYPKTVINWATATDVFAKEAWGEPTPEFFSIASVLAEAEATMETAETETEKKKELEPEQMPGLELVCA